jgi:hypothetical protein
MFFVVVIIIDACFPDYDASLNQRNGTIIPNEFRNATSIENYANLL